MSLPRIRQSLVGAARAEIRRRERLLLLLEKLDLEVVAAAYECCGSCAGAASWLSCPARALDSKVPLAIARTKAGRKKVKAVLKAIHYGNYL